MRLIVRPCGRKIKLKNRFSTPGRTRPNPVCGTLSLKTVNIIVNVNFDAVCLSFVGSDKNMSSTRNEVSVNVSRVIVSKATESDPCRVGCVENPNARILRVVHISDTRSNSESLAIPAGDILVHSGNFFSHDSCKDFCQSLAELDQFFASQPHKYKVLTD